MATREGVTLRGERMGSESELKLLRREPGQEGAADRERWLDAANGQQWDFYGWSSVGRRPMRKDESDATERSERYRTACLEIGFSEEETDRGSSVHVYKAHHPTKENVGWRLMYALSTEDGTIIARHFDPAPDTPRTAFPPWLD